MPFWFQVIGFSLVAQLALESMMRVAPVWAL
jgi:hypothetical protein